MVTRQDDCRGADCPQLVQDSSYARCAQSIVVKQIARDLGVPFDGLWLECPEAVMIARVAARTGDASDATVEVVRRQLGYDLGAVIWHRLEVSGEESEVVAAAERILAR